MFKCEYCNKTFKREGTLAVHVCEPKRRFQQKDSKHVQLAFRSYQLFYRIGTNSKKEKSYEDFSGSQYYTAFVKFGSYCIDLKIDDVPVYTTWLLKNNIAIDRWCSDRNFNTWIKERLKSESCDRAVERTILFLQTWAKENNTTYNNYFEIVSPNLAVFHICSGKISPWVLFNSMAAQGLIDRFNPEQIKMVTDYLEIDYWERAMKVNPQDTKWVKEIMEQATI